MRDVRQRSSRPASSRWVPLKVRPPHLAKLHLCRGTTKSCYYFCEKISLFFVFFFPLMPSGRCCPFAAKPSVGFLPKGNEAERGKPLTLQNPAQVKDTTICETAYYISLHARFCNVSTLQIARFCAQIARFCNVVLTLGSVSLQHPSKKEVSPWSRHLILKNNRRRIAASPTTASSSSTPSAR